MHPAFIRNKPLLPELTTGRLTPLEFAGLLVILLRRGPGPVN
jgi:hypothetical protein